MTTKKTREKVKDTDKKEAQPEPTGGLFQEDLYGLLLEECEQVNVVFKEAEELTDLIKKVVVWKQKCDQILHAGDMSMAKSEARHLA